MPTMPIKLRDHMKLNKRTKISNLIKASLNNTIDRI